jgi:hypothetical protein
VDKKVLVFEKPGQFQIPDLNQEIFLKNHYFIIKNHNPKTLHIKSSKNNMHVLQNLKSHS